MYSKQAKEVLKKYGWYEGRKIDTTKQLAMLEKFGFEVFDKVKEFISEFDGLKLPAENFAIDFDKNNTNNFHYFDISHYIKCMNDLPVDKWEGYKKSLTTHIKSTEKVFPIGGLNGWYLTLYITESGKIIDDRIIYGNSIEEGIENLATHKFVGFIPDKPQELVRTNLLAAFMAERKERWIDIISYAKSGQVSWIYESKKYSIEATNCTWEQIYSKKYILLTFQEHKTEKNVLYDGKGNFVFAYILDENKIFTNEKDFYVVDDLHFVAYDRWQNNLVVLAGDNKLYVYDLNGNMVSQVSHSDALTIDVVRIDDVGYIRIMCNQISNITGNNNVIQSVYNIQYSDYTLVKDLMFD